MSSSKEPPSPDSRNSSPLFLIGRDAHGNWVVQDQHGLYGGLFVNRTEALKFAMFEGGNQPNAVVMVPGVLELDVRRRATTVSPLQLTPAIGQRRAA